MNNLKCLSLFLLLIFAACSKQNVSIINFGEIKASETVGKNLALNSHTGYVHLMHENESPVFMQNEQINAAIGKRFGINVLVTGGKFGEIANLITRVHHPAFKNGSTIDEWESPLNFGITRFTGWHFESQEELVEGLWVFEILDQDRNVLATKQFIISVQN